MNLQMEAMALAMPEVAEHPNRLPFRGVLTLVGIASQRPPSGARGHRVMLTRKATEAALPSLLGMALDYAPALDAHDARRKIGIITEAEIVPLNRRTERDSAGAKAPSMGRRHGTAKAVPLQAASDEPVLAGSGGTDCDQRVSVRARLSRGGGRVARGTRDAGHVVRDRGRVRGESGVAGVDGDFVHVYRSSGAAARQGGVSGDVDRGQQAKPTSGAAA